LSVFPNSNAIFTYYYTNSLTNSNTVQTDFWNNIYPILYTVNSAIAGLTNNTALTPAVRQQLLGEAKFMRAFCYFYLVSLYGDVPLVTGTDYTVNALLPRTPQSQVWQQIISDLKDAQNMLSTNYLDATLLNTTSQRVRPTSWAATALLARSYLYTQNWDSAQVEATTVINNPTLYNLERLNGVFLANSNEAIWQLQPVNFGANTQDAQLFIIPSAGPGGSFPVYLNPLLVNAFEPGDQRRTNWVDSVVVSPNTYYYAYKYKVDSIPSPVTEYEMILRLGEQYLIRAEAEANGAGGGTVASITDLDTIRNRAGLSNYSGATDQASLLTAILHERQVELFTEWGHRWLDLKRTNTVNSVMGSPGNVCAFKGGVWNPDWQWYPIPKYDLQHDPHLVQNSGY
jgi:starch-binding outer membrane protein, SusD/RagB family